MVLKAFSLTHVVYDDEKAFDKLLALITLLPIFLCVSYLTLIAFRRQLHTVMMLVGQLACEVLNNVLKNTIKEPRPAGCENDSYGMPSSHSQFMAYFCVYALLWSVRRVSFEDNLWKLLLNVANVGLSGLVMYSRVALNYHTWQQVTVGAAVGSGFAVLWMLFMESFVEPIMPNIERMWICRYFYLRDSKEIENLMKFEYESAMILKNKRKKSA
eukprot:CAMPEP_0197528502 /NCGR_PEP_ID=MMETSP1318-20131121/25313_1 /TAXON_ID=552666 /ORGANISM="Partenskyella glossopodia, Strain RCC365" /LENGTH=213 /DNA_ID=CAMNT_0043083633 /DNA_START=74 /DNA_END=715 /DNA_ORIENTATION=-